MTTPQKRKPPRKPVFRIGDRVTFNLAHELMHGIISEDRGLIGVGGRRLYQIEADFGEETKVLELGEDDLTLEATAAI